MLDFRHCSNATTIKIKGRFLSELIVEKIDIITDSWNKLTLRVAQSLNAFYHLVYYIDQEYCKFSPWLQKFKEIPC